MYYGEEIGMRTTDPARIEDVHDPIGKLGWPKEKGRDGERTPMQWDSSPNSGFTTSTKPWLPIPPTASTYNVETEKKDPNSIFNTYKTLLALRRSEPALRNGDYTSVDENNPYVFSFLRRSKGSTILVSLNMSAEPRTVSINLAKKVVNENGGDVRLTGTTGIPLYTSPSPGTHAEDEAIPLDKIQLAPFGVLVAKVQ